MRRSPLILLLALTIFAWAPLLAPGYFLRAHDAKHTLFWLVEFDNAIQDGFLWPRWAAEHAIGYGYPIWIFYAPLAYYVAEAFHLLGLSVVAAIKLTWALAMILSGVTMYRFVKRLWGTGPAFITGLLYVYAPYHLVNIYVRASLAEFFAYALFPWVLHTFWDLLEQGGTRRIAVAGISFGLLLLTHSVTIVIFPPILALLIAFWLILRWRHAKHLPWKLTLSALAAGLLGIALSALFLLPAMFEGQYIAQDQWITNTYNYLDQYIYPYQFFDFAWGYGFSQAGPDDGMSMQIGVWLIVLGIAALPLLWRYRPRFGGTLLGFALAATFSLIPLLAISQSLWTAFPPLALVQFPFRFLAPLVLFLSLVAAGVVAALMQHHEGRKDGSPVEQTLRPVLLTLGIAIVFASYPYTKPEHTPVTERDQSELAIIDFETTFTDMRGRTAWAESIPEDSPKIAAYFADETLPLATLIDGQGTVETLDHGAGSERVSVNAASPVTLQFYTYWYPGWYGTIDDKRVDIRYEGELALITLDVPAGVHEVAIRLGSTPLRTIAMLISVLALIVLILLFLLKPLQARTQTTL